MFDDYLDGLDEPRRNALREVVDRVREVAPDAVEGTSYGMPAFRYRDRPLFGFAAHAKHLGVYPFSPEVIATVVPLLDGHAHTKGAVQFTPQHPLPGEVVDALVRGRLREIHAGSDGDE